MHPSCSVFISTRVSSFLFPERILPYAKKVLCSLVLLLILSFWGEGLMCVKLVELISIFSFVLTMVYRLVLYEILQQCMCRLSFFCFLVTFEFRWWVFEFWEKVICTGTMYLIYFLILFKDGISASPDQKSKKAEEKYLLNLAEELDLVWC